MANADELTNIHILNAPAGSGKTHRIKDDIREYVLKNPQRKVLCITYTNRAADELKKGIESDSVYVSTIHSYIAEMMRPLFKKQEIIDLYIEEYKDKIEERIHDLAKEESNQRYIEEYGKLNMDSIRKNIKYIYYNEKKYNSLYFGGLGHDDLLIFTNKVLQEYPKLYQKINRRFSRIIIDEYQDTSPEVFDIFFEAVKGTSVVLQLYGDKMQQIYKEYSSEVEQKLALCNHSVETIVNHRSLPVIVDILNKIYNNTELDQQPWEELLTEQADYSPRVIFTAKDNVESVIESIKREDEKVLVLYIYNRERFSDIGAAKLFDCYNKMKRYGQYQKMTAVNVLLQVNDEDIEDEMLILLNLFYDICGDWELHKYGKFINRCKKNKKIICTQCVSVINMNDKLKISELWSDLIEIFTAKDTTIGYFIEVLNSKNILVDKFMDSIQDEDYQSVMDVKIEEFINLKESLKNPNVSTQHGVKGESHNSVIFVAEDSKRYAPYVYMYDFLRVWSRVNFSLEDFEKFHMDYNRSFYVNGVAELGKLKFNEKTTKEHNKKLAVDRCRNMSDEFIDDDLFKQLCEKSYRECIDHPSKANINNLFNPNQVMNVLAAYKLFYVGCSRARKNLTVIINEQELDVLEDKELLKRKFESVGFEVIP